MLTDSFRQAMEEYQAAARTRENTQKAVSAIYDQMLQMLPQLRPFEEEMRNTVSRAMNDPEIREKGMELYSEHFTEEQIRAWTEFYRTDAGQALVEKLPQVASAHSQMVMQCAQIYLAEMTMNLQSKMEQMVESEDSEGWTPPFTPGS